jgi:FKBP-type peptidyl-prolyl cis-trans isomerase SlyD
MNIKRDCVVAIDYKLRSAEGEMLDESEDEPLEYLHGHGQIVPGLEAALEGAESGQTRKVVVKPSEGYGERDDEAVFTVPRSMFPADLDIAVGAMYVGRDKQGEPLPVTVLEIEADKVVVDANHPLAGHELHFEVTVREVRAATEEELSHGHAHGPDDHHH